MRMAIQLEKISGVVRGYLELHPEEEQALAPLVEALGRGFDFTSRRRYPAHVTAGAALLDGSGRLLQIHHRALGQWLPPGGHSEPDDKSLVETALRELEEETGIGVGDIEQLGGEDAPVRIGVYSIPADDLRGEPAHRHFHFLFAFRTTAPVEVRIGQEAFAYRWRELGQVDEPELGRRLAQIG
jgi:8-oxo-dGTP pyrophosphatase MutT (NUDIX family)